MLIAVHKFAQKVEVVIVSCLIALTESTSKNLFFFSLLLSLTNMGNETTTVVVLAELSYKHPSTWDSFQQRVGYSLPSPRPACK